jgi:hypothetical protein
MSAANAATSAKVRKMNTQDRVSPAAEALATRLEEGARALAELAMTLSPEDWQTRIPHDGRKVGVVVHHVANMYPIEIDLAKAVAAGTPILDLTWDVVHGINAKHAAEKDAVAKQEALDFLAANSAAAAAAIRELTDDELARAVPISLYGGAPLTCQFALEDHAVRHSFHHAAKIRAALGR